MKINSAIYHLHFVSQGTHNILSVCCFPFLARLKSSDYCPCRKKRQAFGNYSSFSLKVFVKTRKVGKSRASAFQCDFYLCVTCNIFPISTKNASIKSSQTDITLSRGSMRTCQQLGRVYFITFSFSPDIEGETHPSYLCQE